MTIHQHDQPKWEIDLECRTCVSISGKKRISPGPTVYEGEFWIIEHAYPVKMTGWFVIILKRHIESLNDVRSEEFAELGRIQKKFIEMLYDELKCEKVYISCFSDDTHFKHILFHVFAKPKKLSRKLTGVDSFAMLKVSLKESVSPKDIIKISQSMRKRWYPNENIITMSPEQIEDFFVEHHQYDCSVGSW